MYNVRINIDTDLDFFFEPPTEVDGTVETLQQAYLYIIKHIDRCLTTLKVNHTASIDSKGYYYDDTPKRYRSVSESFVRLRNRVNTARIKNKDEFSCTFTAGNWSFSCYLGNAMPVVENKTSGGVDVDSYIRARMAYDGSTYDQVVKRMLNKHVEDEIKRQREEIDRLMKE